MTVWQCCQIRLNFDWRKVHFQVQSLFVLAAFSSFSYEVICSAIFPRNLLPRKLQWRYILRLIMCPNQFWIESNKTNSNPCENMLKLFAKYLSNGRGFTIIFCLKVVGMQEKSRKMIWILTQIRIVSDVVSQWFTMDLKLFKQIWFTKYHN